MPPKLKSNIRGDMDKDTPEKSYQRSAVVFTIICMASSLFAFASMNTMGALIPVIISGVVHLIFGLSAILFTLQSGSFLRNICIYAYFAAIALFFLWLTGVNERFEKKFDQTFNSVEYELFNILEPMALLNRTPQTVDASAIQRAMVLMKKGVDPFYVFPGDSRNIAILAVSADVSEVVRLLFKQNPKLLNKPRMMEILMRKAISFGRINNIEVLLSTGVHFPLSKYENDFKYSPGFKYYPERLPEMYLRFKQHEKMAETPASNRSGL
jgi:hypothetical protein